jgi:hypothetical protein
MRDTYTRNRICRAIRIMYHYNFRMILGYLLKKDKLKVAGQCSAPGIKYRANSEQMHNEFAY